MRTIVVVGVGALGSHVVPLLRNIHDTTVKVIDFDRVEQKNTQSQFHGKPGVGKSKVEALKTVTNFLWGMKLDTNSNKLVQNNSTALLGAPSLVIDCLDNGEARRVVQGHVRGSKIPCLHGALAPEGQFGRVVWDETFVIDDESAGGAATCENGEHLPFIAITSAYLAQAAKVFLTAGKKVGYSINPAGAMTI